MIEREKERERKSKRERRWPISRCGSSKDYEGLFTQFMDAGWKQLGL